MLELRSFAVGCQGELATLPSERLEHIPNTANSFDSVELFGFGRYVLGHVGSVCAKHRPGRAL
jgi:hypothetical protein